MLRRKWRKNDMEKRVFLIVLDSFGIGAEPDAAAFGDEGTNTLGAIAKHPNFNCPNLQKLGLFNIDGVTAGEKSAVPTLCSSWEPWEKLKRATFMPLAISSRRTPSLSVEGPRVQIIFVFLIQNTSVYVLTLSFILQQAVCCHAERPAHTTNRENSPCCGLECMVK